MNAHNEQRAGGTIKAVDPHSELKVPCPYCGRDMLIKVFETGDFPFNKIPDIARPTYYNVKHTCPDRRYSFSAEHLTEDAVRSMFPPPGEEQFEEATELIKRKVRKETLEEIYSALCSDCRKGLVPWRDGGFSGDDRKWFHPKGKRGGGSAPGILCDAYLVREYVYQKQKQEGT